MSGIAGFFHRDGRQADPAMLERMSATLTHRGPVAGAWIGEKTGLACRTLVVTPEARCEHLPVTDPTGQLVLAADARIDNRDELRAALGHPAATASDGTLILLAYERWSEECPFRLVGDFAFALWDGRRQRLFCARDHIGVKPFYYFQSDSLFAFGSEIKALYVLSEIPRKVNEARVAELLARHFEDKTSTLHAGVERLPPAHAISVGRDSCRRRKYWQLDSRRGVLLPTRRAYEEAFRELLTEAVRCRTRSEGAIGAALSGGLDSSSIVCLASRCLAPGAAPLHTFSALFSGLPEKDRRRSDEESYIRSVLATVGRPVHPHFVRADLFSPLRDVERMLWHEDEAFLAPNLYMHWALYEAARPQGVRVFLDGIDGDSTVSFGLDFLTDLARTLRWRRLMKEARDVCRRPEVALSPLKAALRFGFKPLVPGSVTRLWDRLRRQGRPPFDPRSVVNPELAERVRLKQRTRDHLGGKPTLFCSERNKHRASLESGLIPLGLEVLDKAAAAFGIEPRYPFFDRRLMEFCLGLPSEQKLADGWPRSIHRRGMAGILPDDVCWRFSKADLSPSFQWRLLDYEKATLERCLVDPNGALAPYVDLRVLGAAYTEYRTAPVTAIDEALAVYGAVMLGLWLERAETFSYPSEEKGEGVAVSRCAQSSPWAENQRV